MKSKVNFNNFKGGPRNVLLLVFFFAVSIALLSRLTDYSRATQVMSYSEFLKKVELNQVKSVYVEGTHVYGTLHDKSHFETVVADVPKNWDILREHNVEFSVGTPSAPFSIWPFLFVLLLALVPFVLWFFFKQSRGGSGEGGSNIFSMGKSKAKMFMPSQIKTTFDSVAGAVEAKEDLADVVDFLKNPDKYRRLGARLTRGVLLVGEPGNGKTLLAKAVAGEANCPFFSISGSDFIEVFVGVGAARVRDLFAQARKYAPSIIFIDEIDAVGRQRGTGLGGGHDEREQTLNQLLTEMDGFDTGNTAVVVIAATNRPDVLDKALLRRGRFDRQVVVPYPDLVSREQILQVHAKNIKIDPAVDLKKMARATIGLTGADLAHIINGAAIIAAKKGREMAVTEDLEEVRDQINLGKERKTIILTEKDLRETAFHEAGHALITVMLPETAEPLHKVTINPRGSSLGATHRIPKRDKYSYNKEEKLTEIKIALGGRIGEEVACGIVSTGAASDFMSASQIARSMVCVYGMSDKLGQVIYQQSGDFKYSEETARLIDEEVRAIIEKCYQEAKDIIVNNRDKLDMIAHALLEKETLSAEEVHEMLGIPLPEVHSLQ